MWLVKIPAFVAEEWAKAGDDSVLGTMKISMVAGTNGAPPTKKINIKLNANEKAGVGSGNNEAGIPDEFTLEDVSSAPKMFAFSGDDDSDKFVMQGQVSKNMLLKPRGTKEYQEYLWNRNAKSTIRRETIRAADDKAAFTMSRTDTVVDFVPPAASLQKRKSKETSQAIKKSGGVDAISEVKALRTKVFEAFSRAEHVTLSDLQAFCSETSGYSPARLKELTDDYCKYHPKGTYKHFYELKPEFKDNSKVPAGEAARS
jgi:hypothetical protein